MKRKFTSAFAIASLALATAFISPASASASPSCTSKNGVKTCTGVTTAGGNASYSFAIPSNFNGTFLLWSHGLRSNVALPAAFGPLGGPVNSAPEMAPSVDLGSALLAAGFGIGGSGFSRQGWNLDEAVKANGQLIGIVKSEVPAVKKVVSWGSSLGGIISQGTAESYPKLVDAVGPLCAVAQGPLAIGSYLDDVLYGLKVFFDPKIKGGNYSSGQAGYLEALGDIQRVIAVLTHVQQNIAGTPAASWPATSTVGPAFAEKGISARSALLLVGLVAGVPTQSKSFDGITGPGDPNDPTNTAYDGFVWVYQPALAVLENIASFVGQAILGRYDAEIKAGGNPLDNTKTDYASRLGDNRDTYGTALSGDDAIDAMLQVMAASTPLKSKADATALAKTNGFLKVSGKVTKPTIAMTTVIDPFVTAGNTQWYADQYAKQYAAQKAAAKAKAKKVGKRYVAPAKKFMALYTQPLSDKWTTFNGATPIPAQVAPDGTSHCGFSVGQYVTIAYLLSEAAANGQLPDYDLSDLVNKQNGFVEDPLYEATLPFYFRK